MFVAFELQIGLEAEVVELRKDHLAYERGRILESQPLLNAYLEAIKDNKELSSPSSLFIDKACQLWTL